MSLSAEELRGDCHPDRYPENVGHRTYTLHLDGGWQGHCHHCEWTSPLQINYERCLKACISHEHPRSPDPQENRK